MSGQVPQGFNYQAVARNSTGQVLAIQSIAIRFTLTNGNGGTMLYQETNTTTTNQFGLFTLVIGNGNVMAGVFASIQWDSVSAWLEVEMDPTGGTNYSSMGSSQLFSVPYAMYAQNGNPGPPGPQGVAGADGVIGPAGPSATDTLVQRIAVNGWLNGLRIHQTFTDTLDSVLTMIDSGSVDVYRGFYPVSSTLTKDNIVWTFHDGANVTSNMTDPLFDMNGYIHDVRIDGQGTFFLNGSFLSRHNGTGINVFVNFRAVKSIADTCIVLRYLEDTLKMVVIKGNALHCENYPTMFMSYTQQNYFNLNVDSVTSTQSSVLIWSVLGNGAYPFHTGNITIQAGLFKTDSPTEYAVYIDYLGQDFTVGTFNDLISYNVARTKGSKTIYIGHLGFQYTLQTQGIFTGQCDFNFNNGEHTIASAFVDATISLGGFKTLFTGFIYDCTFNVGATSTVGFSNFMRKTTFTINGPGSRAYFPSHMDITKTGVFINAGAEVFMNGRMADTSGVVINTGGKLILKGTIQSNSWHSYPIVLAGGTFELCSGGRILQVDNSSTYNAGISVTENSTFIHDGGTIVVPSIAGAQSISVDAGKTLTVRNYNNYFTNKARGGAGTFAETISGGGTEIVDLDVE
ncbi:MAG: hypothetical protein ABI763_14535 [Bacteroidota bacterium]